VAVKQLGDGRWAVYYRNSGKLKWEYFGRGDLSELKARQRDEQIKRDRNKNRPPFGNYNCAIAQLLSEYHSRHRVQASTADSDFYRIDRVLIPLLGSHCAENLSPQSPTLHHTHQMPEVQGLSDALLFPAHITSAGVPGR